MESIEVTRAGYGGVLPNGNVVDRREHPDAIPLQRNPSMGIPEPKEIEKSDELRK